MSISDALNRQLKNEQMTWTSLIGLDTTLRGNTKTLLQFKTPSINDLYSNVFTTRKTKFKMLFNIYDFVSNFISNPTETTLDTYLNRMLIYKFDNTGNNHTIWDMESDLETRIEFIDKRRIGPHCIIEGYIEKTT